MNREINVKRSLESTGGVTLLRGNEIIRLFEGREAAIMESVRQAYLLKEQGDYSAPNCPFLRFPGNTRDRIIPKPAFLGGSFQVAGMKWVASFPDNIRSGMDRASATLILNSTRTGQPEAILEGSVINACRTAASAALAASVLREGRSIHSVGILGCGPINFETVRFLLATHPEIAEFLLFDTDPAQARRFLEKCPDLCGTRHIALAPSATTLFREADVVSLATNATIPHLDNLDGCRENSVILHISLRDLAPEVILAGDNVVDDVEHVCSNRTSLDLAVQKAGNRDCIRATLGAILLGQKARRGGEPVIFSPFGLGILDLAVARLAVDLARAEGIGTIIDGFVPTPWPERRYAPLEIGNAASTHA
jgi:2,3-diaminopropionate biosynthesis protein SbnB